MEGIIDVCKFIHVVLKKNGERTERGIDAAGTDQTPDDRFLFLCRYEQKIEDLDLSTERNCIN